MINHNLSAYIFSLILLLLFAHDLKAQKAVQISLFPGFTIINSDDFSGVSGTSQTNRAYGGNVAVNSSFNEIPLELSAGYLQGKSRIIEQNNFQLYSVDLRYRTLPVEILMPLFTPDRIKVLTGLNIVGQQRTLIYTNSSYYHPDIQNDRLLSFGIGLSGKASLILSEINDGNGFIFLNISARWTEFLVHNSRGRDTSDFKYRHFVISPQLGVSFDLN